MHGFYTYGFEVLDESGIEDNTLLYLALRSLYNSHFPSQCTIACEMGILHPCLVDDAPAPVSPFLVFSRVIIPSVFNKNLTLLDAVANFNCWWSSSHGVNCREKQVEVVGLTWSKIIQGKYRWQYSCQKFNAHQRLGMHSNQTSKVKKSE